MSTNTPPNAREEPPLETRDAPPSSVTPPTYVLVSDVGNVNAPAPLPSDASLHDPHEALENVPLARPSQGVPNTHYATSPRLDASRYLDARSTESDQDVPSLFASPPASLTTSRVSSIGTHLTVPAASSLQPSSPPTSSRITVVLPDPANTPPDLPLDLFSNSSLHVINRPAGRGHRHTLSWTSPSSVAADTSQRIKTHLKSLSRSIFTPTDPGALPMETPSLVPYEAEEDDNEEASFPTTTDGGQAPPPPTLPPSTPPATPSSPPSSPPSTLSPRKSPILPSVRINQSPSGTSSSATSAQTRSPLVSPLLPVKRRKTTNSVRHSLFTYRPELPHSFHHWCIQLYALLRKHFKVMLHGNFTLLLLVLAAPVLFMLVASSIYSQLSSTLELVIFPFSWDLNGTTPVTLGKMPVCSESAYYCSPSFYYTPMDPYHTAVMQQFAQLAGYSKGEMVGFESQAALVDSYYANNRQLLRRPRHYIIQFSTFASLPQLPNTFDEASGNVSLLKGTWYTIGEGRSNILRSGFDPLLKRDYSVAKSTLLTVSLLLDKAIINVRSGKQHQIDLSLAALPRYTEGLVPLYKQSQADAEAMKLLVHYASNLLTPCLIAMSAFPLLLLILQLIAEDKFDGMLTRLRHMNLSESSYWISILVVCVALSTISSLLALLPAQLISYHSIQAIHPAVFFLLLWMFMISFTLTGCLAVTLSSSHYTSGVLTVLYMVMCTLALFVLPLIDLNQFYSKATLIPWWSTLPDYAYYLISFFPFLQFSRSLGYLIDIGRNTTALSWSNAFAPSTTVSGAPYVLTMTLVSQLMVLVFMLVVLWYTFQVVGTHGKPWNFPLKKRPTPTTSTNVEIVQVCQRFGKVQILHDLNIVLKKGTATALLGHNGSGKSTLIDILSGTEAPYSGTARLFGDAVGTPEAKHRLGVCPQNDLYYPSLNAYEHMHLWCRLKGIPETKLKRYIDTLLSAVSLNKEDIKGLALEFYSGGMKRRLSLISACIAAPDLIILDEPTNGLDPIHRRHVWEFVASLKSHSALLLTSHSTLEVDALAEDVIVLAEGRVILNRNLMELRQEHAIELQVCLSDANALEMIPCPLLSCRTVKSKEVIIKLDRIHFPEICMFLDSPSVLDWKLYSSLESFLPPQPGTEVHQEELAMGASKNPSNASLNLAGTKEIGPAPLKNPGLQPRFIQLLNQVIGLLIKNLKTQLEQVRYNIVFMALFVGILLALNFISKSANQGLCPNGGHLPLIDPLNPTVPATCDVQTYSNLTKAGFNLCQPSSTNFCPLPDYAVIKQLSYQNNPVPRIWIHAPDTLKPLINIQTVPTIPPSQILDASPVFVQLGMSSMSQEAWMVRPKQVVYVNESMESWVSDLRKQQMENARNISNQTLPRSCNALVEKFSQSPWRPSVVTAESAMQNWLPDFGVGFSNFTPLPDLNGAMRASVDLRYFTMSAYPFATYFFSYPYANATGEQCKAIGVNPTSFLNARILSNEMAMGPYPEQSNLPSFKLQDKKNQIESLFLLDSPIRHMMTSAMTTIARALVEPSETLFVDFMAVFDLEYSLRNELVMNAMIGVLIWIFFSMFIFIPMSEQGKFVGFYRVNGMSMPAYWTSQYLYCFIYSIPFMFALCLTLALIQPGIALGHLVLTVMLSMHSVIGLSFLYASIAVTFGFSSIATFLSYLAPILVAIPCSIFVYSDVISLPASVTFYHLAFPGMAIAFAFRQLQQNFDLVYLNAAYMWLAVVGLGSYLMCIGLNMVRDLRLVRAAERKTKKSLNPPVPGGDMNLSNASEMPGGLAFQNATKLATRTSTSSTLSPSPHHSTSVGLGPGSTTLTVNAAHVQSSLLRHPTIHEHEVLQDIPEATPTAFPTHRRVHSTSSTGVPTEPRRGRHTHHRGASSSSVLTVDSHVAREAVKVRNPEEPFIVKLDQVCKTYGTDDMLLENLSFMIEPHESFGLLGANGCGKSHTVKIITGQMQPTSGTVEGPPAYMLGVCPQENFLIDPLSVNDNFLFYAQLKGYSYHAAIQASQMAAKMVGLTKFLARKIHQLSGGMKRRVSLGIALLGSPTMLIADEPTTALDVHHQLNLWRILTRLQRDQALALLLVSHDMDEISYLCQRIGILKKSLVCVGTPLELKRKYGHQWRLRVQCARDQAEDIRKWVGKLADNVLETTLTDATPFFAEKIKLEFSIPKSQTRLYLLVQTMTVEAAGVGIREWSVEPWSLEDVFVRVVLGRFRTM